MNEERYDLFSGKKELANLEESDDLNQRRNFSLCGHRTEYSGKKQIDFLVLSNSILLMNKEVQRFSRANQETTERIFLEAKEFYHPFPLSYILISIITIQARMVIGMQ